MKYHIETKGKDKAYMILYRRVREDIVSGVYAYGTRIPSKRQMAERTGVSVITVEHAYDLLMEEGYLEARERSGYFVSYKEEVSFAIGVKGERSVPTLLKRTRGKEIFPFSVYARAVRTVLSRWGDTLWEASPHEGMKELREALSHYLARSRGMMVPSDRIWIGAGAEYVYHLIIQGIVEGESVAIESPGYPKAREIYEAHHIKTEALAMGKEGIVSEALRTSKAKILHVTPFHSYPTGITATASKRQEYIRWAEDRDGLIIEDDFDSEFTLLTKAEDTLFALASDGRVVYMNTFSQTIAPSVRIGYVVIPKGLEKKFKNRIGFYSCTVPVLEQLVLAELLDNGDFERHINRVRRQRRRNIKKEMPGKSISI